MSKDAVKVVLLGANSVGKTCFMRRYVEKRFYEEMRPTVGTDFMVQTETTAKGKVNFQIWDTEGYGNDDDYTNNVLNGAKVVVLMYSIVDRPSFDKLSYWTDAVKKMIPKARPLVYVVGTKLDIAEEDSNKRMVTLEMADPVADEFGCIGVVETSAKTGEKIDELFGIIAQDYLARPGKKSGTCAVSKSVIVWEWVKQLPHGEMFNRSKPKDAADDEMNITKDNLIYEVRRRKHSGKRQL